jgi:prepilin-type N-terminal cleavage/methylation domain-containing protein
MSSSTRRPARPAVPRSALHVPRSAGAFTLIELLVVISIVVVFTAGMVPPFLKNTDRFRLKDSARRLSDLMSFCHSMAVFEAAAFRLDFDVQRGRCRVLFEEDPVAEPGRFRPFRMSGYSVYTLQQGVMIEDLSIAVSQGDEIDDSDYIEFRSDGTADEAAVVLANEKGDCCTILLSPLTSGVRILEHALDEGEPEETGNAERGARNAERGMRNEELELLDAEY